ncbi:MAG: indolepyruvate ferredoxin oxidoreductase subunit alpha [Desulfomonilaceae bacterium]
MSIVKNDSPNLIRFLMGNEAIARGVIESGCALATAYPGTPSSEVMESLTRWKKELRYPIYLEWSINEKVAFEVAYGASLAGSRSAVIMKMVGLNVASDPLLSAAYLGVRGGLVVIVADDPGPHSSQTEQDSRFFAWFAKVPVYDPASPAEALSMTRRAFELSEKYHVPVMLRPCLRVCHARQNVSMSGPLDPVTVGPFQKNWTKWAATPKFRLVLHGELNEKIKNISLQESDTRPRLISGAKESTLAIITSGSVSSHVQDIVVSDSRLSEVPVYKMDAPYPANQKALQELVDSKTQTLIIEETYPVIELQLIDKTKIIGKISGHVPQQGELTPEVVERIIMNFSGLETEERVSPTISARRPSLCAGCPHRPAFFMIKKLFSESIFTGDIGCYTLGVNLGAVDTCLCIGASIGMASGFAHAADKTDTDQVVATIGDSTFFHAGVPALINAVHTGANFVLVLMDNNITAMTGGQPTPGTDFLADGAPAVPVDMEKLIRGCGVKSLEVVDPYDYRALEEALSTAKSFSHEKRSGVSVVITRRACIRTRSSSVSNKKFQVGENCDRCMTCIRDLECPAISFVKQEKTVQIDLDLCSGCGFCVDVCPSQAIAAWRNVK